MPIPRAIVVIAQTIRRTFLAALAISACAGALYFLWVMADGFVNWIVDELWLTTGIGYGLTTGWAWAILVSALLVPASFITVWVYNRSGQAAQHEEQRRRKKQARLKRQEVRRQVKAQRKQSVPNTDSFQK